VLAVHLCSHTLLSVQALRGRLWQIFLCLDRKREAGMYEQLVQKALGNTKYGRKVRRIHLPPSCRFVCDSRPLYVGLVKLAPGHMETSGGSLPRMAPNGVINCCKDVAIMH